MQGVPGRGSGFRDSPLLSAHENVCLTGVCRPCARHSTLDPHLTHGHFSMVSTNPGKLPLPLSHFPQSLQHQKPTCPPFTAPSLSTLAMVVHTPLLVTYSITTALNSIKGLHTAPVPDGLLLKASHETKSNPVTLQLWETGKKAPWVKLLPAKADDLSPMAGTHKTEEK